MDRLRDAIKSSEAIITAAADGELNRLKELVAEYKDKSGSANTDMSFNNDVGIGVIHCAAAGGNLSVLDYVIEELGLDVNLKDERGDSPLIFATVFANVNTVEYLLGKGADPNTSNNRGYTPLHCAAVKGLTEILTRLLSKGADVNALSEDGTPLDVAANNGQLEVLQILLDQNANPNLISGRAYTALTGSIKSGLPQSLRSVELLLEAGANPDSGSYGVTPLTAAATNGLTEIIKRLIQAGANPDVTDNYGLTPLEIAALKGYRNAVEILFPITSRIPEYIDWSVDGVIGHVHSDQAKEQRRLKCKEMFDEAKLCGADAFKKHDYSKAVVWYSQANNIYPNDANVLSNRSMCFARMEEGVMALKDAYACLSLRPDWPKAYYRVGVACNVLKRYHGAQQAFLEGLKLSPNNQELKDAYREAAEALLNSL